MDQRQMAEAYFAIVKKQHEVANEFHPNAPEWYVYLHALIRPYSAKKAPSKRSQLLALRRSLTRAVDTVVAEWLQANTHIDAREVDVYQGVRKHGVSQAEVRDALTRLCNSGKLSYDCGNDYYRWDDVGVTCDGRVL